MKCLFQLEQKDGHQLFVEARSASYSVAVSLGVGASFFQDSISNEAKRREAFSKRMAAFHTTELSDWSTFLFESSLDVFGRLICFSYFLQSLSCPSIRLSKNTSSVRRMFLFVHPSAPLHFRLSAHRGTCHSFVRTFFSPFKLFRYSVHPCVRPSIRPFLARKAN